jgi:hypothetical protein
MQRIISGLTVLLVLFVIVVYARDCRLSFNQWKHCGSEPGQTAFLGDWVQFNWKLPGIFNDVLYVGGKPAARLVKYHFRLVDDILDIESLDGTQKSSYCGK